LAVPPLLLFRISFENKKTEGKIKNALASESEMFLGRES
jgi:hypothetical protein